MHFFNNLRMPFYDTDSIDNCQSVFTLQYTFSGSNTDGSSTTENFPWKIRLLLIWDNLM